jgi:hypothetical protein
MSFDQNRATDVDQLVGMLKSLTGRDATAQDMHDAWEARSEGVCATWLVFDENDDDDRQEVRRAYDALILDRFRTQVLAAVPEHDHGIVVDFVRDRGSDDHDETDEMVVVTDAQKEADVLARYVRWSGNHQKLVVDLLERFDVTLPDGHDLSDHEILDAFGLQLVD